MRKKSPDGWVMSVDSNLIESLVLASCASYENGCALLFDASVLLAAGRFARSCALAILSEEEFAKAFVLCIAIRQKRWDSNLFSGLLNHAPKQAIAEAFRTYWKWARENDGRLTREALEDTSKFAPSYEPSLAQMSEMLGQLDKSHVKQRVRDKQKQNFLYVGVDRMGNVSNNPSEASIDDATSAINDANEFQEITEHMLSNTLPNFEIRRKSSGR